MFFLDYTFLYTYRQNLSYENLGVMSWLNYEEKERKGRSRIGSESLLGGREERRKGRVEGLIMS